MENNNFKYSDYYKKQVKKNLEEIRRRRTLLERAEKDLEKQYREVRDYLSEPKHIKILKIIVVLVALGIFGFILYNQFIISHDFNYFYDIGGEEDAKKPYLYPIERFSEISNISEVDYRDLMEGLVYFDVPLARNSETIRLQVRFSNNFPENGTMRLGARDKVEWHYQWRSIYNSSNLKVQDWLISGTEFNPNKENLTILNNKLNIALDIFHLSPNQNETNQMYIPIDWINITVHKPGLLEKYEIKSWRDISNIWKSKNETLV